MKLYELIQHSCYRGKNLLSYFTFTLYDRNNLNYLTIENPSLEDFVKLCGREVSSYEMSYDLENKVFMDILIPTIYKEDIDYWQGK